jgi:selenocysteine-specific elongation factor
MTLVETSSPLTVGTAGHIDHGKTALVKRLTGVDTDRLPEEKQRGLTIALGYASLRLPSGRLLSLVDVPGHERLIRVMVSGATGIDLYLMVIAADDGVMPQTLEHVRVLEALGVTRGVVVVTKADLADPEPTAAAGARLLPGSEVVACSARTGAGIADVAAALERVAAQTPSRSAVGGSAVLHIDRVFTIKGAGTVVTGTLWSGRIGRGDHLTLLPAGRRVRVRGVHVHDLPREEALAGQRVAVNLSGVDRTTVTRGDVLASPDAPLAVAHRIEADLLLPPTLEDRWRVQVHHGTRDVPGRAIRLGPDRWQLRVERPLVAAPGDHLVVRRISPPETLGGGVIRQLSRPGDRDGAAARPGAEPAARPGGEAAARPGGEAAARPRGGPGSRPSGPALDAESLALEERLRAAGHEPPTVADLGDDAGHLAALIAAGRAVRVGRAMYAHPEAIARVRAAVERIARDEGSITLARLRDELGTSRKYAEAMLGHLDAARVTRRREDDSRVLRRYGRAAPGVD